MILVIVVKKPKSLKIPARLWQDALRVGARAMGQHFKRFMLPLRFTKRGATRLKYAPRSGEPGSGRAFRGSYTWKKMRRHENGQGVRAIGETKPFVWSGRARNAARNSSRVQVASPGRGRAWAHVAFGPTEIQRNPKYLPEIKRVAAVEERELGEVLAKAADKHIQRRLARR